MPRVLGTRTGYLSRVMNYEHTFTNRNMNYEPCHTLFLCLLAAPLHPFTHTPTRRNLFTGRGTVDFVSSRLADVLSEELRADDHSSIEERITRCGHTVEGIPRYPGLGELRDKPTVYYNQDSTPVHIKVPRFKSAP